MHARPAHRRIYFPRHDRKAQRAKESMLRRFHVTEKIRIMNDPGHVGFRKLDPPSQSKFMRHFSWTWVPGASLEPPSWFPSAFPREFDLWSLKFPLAPLSLFRRYSSLPRSLSAQTPHWLLHSIACALPPIGRPAFLPAPGGRRLPPAPPPLPTTAMH